MGYKVCFALKCFGAVLAFLAGLDVLASSIFGLDRVTVGLRVGSVPQPGWLGQGIFLTVTAVLSFLLSIHPFIHLSTHTASQARRKASHYLGVEPTNPHSAPLACSLHPYIRLMVAENPTSSQLNKTEIKHPPESI